MTYLKSLLVFFLLLFSISSNSTLNLNKFLENVELADRALLYGDVEAMKEMGKKLEQAGLTDASFKYYLKAAKKRDRFAIERLQILYAQGVGTSGERMTASIYLGIQKCARLFSSQK